MSTTTKVCPRCGEAKTPAEFYQKQGRRAQSLTYCKQCHNQYTTERCRSRKKQAVAYLGGRCADCGGMFPYYVYDFHHRDPAQKDVQFNKLRRRAWESITAELDKCDLLCANCHRTRHWQEFDDEEDSTPELRVRNRVTYTTPDTPDQREVRPEPQMVPLVLALALSAPPEAPEFAVTGTGADTPFGKLTALSLATGAQVATSDGPKTVKDLVSLRQLSARPALPGGAHLITAAGDRIPGTLLGGDAKQLRFKHAANDDEWALALSAVAVVWLKPAPADTPTDPAKYPWLTGTPTRDVLLYRNGDTARGAITALTDTGAKFTPDGGAAREVPFTDLAAIGFNPRFVRPRKPKGPYAALTLLDGTRVAADEVELKVGTLVCQAVSGPKFDVPLAKLVALEVLQGPATYLSDLKPAKVETVGFLGAGWPWTADRTVRGQPLRLLQGDAENTFDKGLGTHPKTTLTYDLAGKYTRFEVLVGLDPKTGKRGRADVRVRVDGKEVPLPELKALGAGNAVPVAVDVRKAKELTLVIDFGPTGDVQADVNWGGARLITE